jgi:hypothetical protein
MGAAPTIGKGGKMIKLSKETQELIGKDLYRSMQWCDKKIEERKEKETVIKETYEGFRRGDVVTVGKKGPYAKGNSGPPDNRMKTGYQVYVIDRVCDRFMVDLFYWDETRTIKYRGGSIDSSLLEHVYKPNSKVIERERV